MKKKIKNDKEIEISNLLDRLSFYETLTHVKILQSSKDEQIYDCLLTNGINYKLTFSFLPYSDDKIQYKPGKYFKKNENLEDIEQIHPEFLGKSIAFKESKIPAFLMRIHKYIEDDNDVIKN